MRGMNDAVFSGFIAARRVEVREAYVFSDREAPAECLPRRAPATVRRPPAKRGRWPEPCVTGAVYFNRLLGVADVLSSARGPRSTEIERMPPWQTVCGIKIACIDERAR